ncbi:EAL domain-containing protein [Zavarzinia compransoris]|uniref:EAL domain-containing protein n=1 Tax=Zavarzinia marina TaxID=2911065 RepID=UPI001F46E355|nr:EAL domain-containing protein [Zavarzinia marina]MCF4167086.1 EAL domain-containing protein [Zavarzinia marina]
MPERDNRIHVKAGDIVMAQGEAGHCAYLIESGRIEILLTAPTGERQFIGTRGPGTLIGEMAIIDEGTRSATIRAIEDCALLEISRADFARRLDGADPILQMAMRTILARFRDLMQRSRLMHDVAHPPLLTVEDVERDHAHLPGAVEAITIANEFRPALEAGEITLHYQPIVDLRDGRPAGFEALMRWHRPGRGPLSPDIFIPVLEASGQIVAASDWVLREALRALGRIEAGSGRRGLFMSVNFSAQDFTTPDFPDRLLEAIGAAGIAPSQVHLEITERLLMAKPEDAQKTLTRCRQAGMGVSIDDFGTGYSSLSYLRAFPIDTLKIDRSFVTDMTANDNSMALISSIVALGKNMGLKLIAEGIETRDEAAMLRNMGCNLGQGYFFARPMAEEAVTAFAAQDRTIAF